MQPSLAQPESLPVYRTNRKVLIPAFLVVVFLYWMALYLFVPTLPIYIQTKTSDLALVGTALSMYGLWQLICRLPLGISVDWLGRRKYFLIVWLGLVAAGDWILGTSAGIEGAMVGRALVGVGAATWVLLVVMFSSLFRPDETVRATAILAMVGTLGRIVATSLNGWLNQLGGYPLAFQLAAGSALVAAAIVLFLPDISASPNIPSLSNLYSLVKRRNIMLPSLLQSLLHVAEFASTFTFIPIVARQMGASDVILSVLLSLSLVIGFLGNYVSAALVRKMGSWRLSGLCFLVLAIGLLGTAASPTLVFIFFFQMWIGLGFGMGYPLLMGLSIQQVENSQRTTAMGLHQSVYSLGMFIGPWLSGRLAAQLGINPMFAIVAAMTLVLGIIGSLALRAEH